MDNGFGFILMTAMLHWSLAFSLFSYLRLSYLFEDLSFFDLLYNRRKQSNDYVDWNIFQWFCGEYSVKKQSLA